MNIDGFHKRDPLLYPEDWNIFPLKRNSKYPPLIKEWESIRYNRDLLKEHVGNYALGTGDISGGIIVFDWDFRKGFNRKIEGFKEIYREYKEKLGDLAFTLIAETPNGYHFYYHLKGEEYRNTSQENGGFSKSLKSFISKNTVRFGKYLKGLDTRANGGYVVIPPSKVKEGSYKWLVVQEIKEITDSEYKRIFDFFKERDEVGHTIRGKFVDLIMGKLDPHDLKRKEFPEHVYWKEMYHEAWRCCGLRAEDLFSGLSKHQKAFNQAKTEEQLKNQKNIEYIYSISRLSKEKYEGYFRVRNELDENLDVIEEEEEDTLCLEGRGNIIVREDGLYLEKVYKKSVEYNQVLEGKLELNKLAYETMNNNRLLVTGMHDQKVFRTLPMDVLLTRLKDYIYQGNIGTDVVKKYIHELKKDLKVYDLSYVLGFNSHWSMPCLEEKGNFQIITSTDKQIEAYERCKKLPIIYSEKEKEEILKLLKEFVDKTKINKTKLAIIIGWSVAAPFRHIFIDVLDLFPILCCYGPRKTGKTAILKFFCVNFFGIHMYYNSSLLYSTSRFEDVLSTGSFPIFIEEIITVPLDILSILKEHATNSSRFFRKKNARENDFDCLKSAPIVFDCNNAVRSLMDPATNSKLTLVPFSEDEAISIDVEWIELRKKLSQYNLFSLMFEYTRDWSEKDVEERVQKYIRENPLNEEDDKNNPRILQQWIILQFGIDLFKEIFDIELDNSFLDLLRFGRTRMTQSLLSDFYSFCIVAMNYYPDADGKFPPIKYLSHPLEEYKSRQKGEGYLFKSTNKADFQNFTKDKFTLEDLSEKLVDALQDIHKGLISNHNTGKKRGIFIKKDFFNLNIFKENKPLKLEDVEREYGEPPED